MENKNPDGKSLRRRISSKTVLEKVHCGLKLSSFMKKFEKEWGILGLKAIFFSVLGFACERKMATGCSQSVDRVSFSAV